MVKKYVRHDWNILLSEFMMGHYKTLKEFARIKELNDRSSQFFLHTKGWIRMKEAVTFNPELIEKYKADFHLLLKDLPPNFYTASRDKFKNAAFTYICDIRVNPYNLYQIAYWYGLNAAEVKERALKENWEAYRKFERIDNTGLVKYITDMD